MEEARKRPKILLLRAAPTEETRDAWARLAKALKSFTDLDERELTGVTELEDGFDAVFLDTALVPWSDLKNLRHPTLCLVQAGGFSWADPVARVERFEAVCAHPFLLLESFSSSDLLRVLHLFLVPKRLAGATPLMEKGSLIIGEKVMEPNAVGLLLDRVSTFLEKVEDFGLQARVPDVRQVLSALLLEGLHRGREKGVAYPFVDFQVAPGSRKLAMNLRFPRGNLALDTLVRDTLGGTNLFWHQIWQCSDLVLLTHHQVQDELEVMVLLCDPERNVRGRFRSLLWKTSDQNRRRDDLLHAPDNYRFMLISEIVAKDGADVHLFTADDPTVGDSALADMPEAAVQKIRHFAEQCRVLNDHLGRKDMQLQELTKTSQRLAQELNGKRAEVIRAVQARDATLESSERKIRELEDVVKHLRDAAVSKASAKDSQANTALQELVTRLETTLRAAENEKLHLKESILNEQRRAGSLEQKYSNLYKELATKDREIIELKAGMNKLRKEVDMPARTAAEEKKEASGSKVKELEDREVVYKQEVKRFAYKIEAMEKNLKVVQADAAEKQKLLEQKLAAAKAKEVDLMRRLEEAAAHLKKAKKAA